jgi:hypothetical protein
MLLKIIGIGLLFIFIGIYLHLSANRIPKEKTLEIMIKIILAEKEEARNILIKLQKLLKNSSAEYESTKDVEIKSVFKARSRLSGAILKYLLKNDYSFNLLKRITAIDVEKISIDEMEKLTDQLNKTLETKTN